MRKLFSLLAFFAIATCCIGAAEPTASLTTNDAVKSPFEKTTENGVTVFLLDAINELRNDELAIPASTSEDYSLVVWCNPEGYPVLIGDFCLLSCVTPALNLTYTKDKCFQYNAILDKPKWVAIKSPVMSSERWYQLVVVAQNSAQTLAFYVNGQLVAQQQLESKLPMPKPKFNVGCLAPSDRNHRFHGKFNALRFYDTALSAEEVSAMFEAEHAPYAPLGNVVVPKDAVKASSYPLPVFLNALPEAKLAQFKADFEQTYADNEQKFYELREQLRAVFGGTASLQEERVEKRLEIAEGLFPYVRRNMESANADGIYYAYYGMYSLEEFFNYFKQEMEQWKNYPRLKTDKDPGNNPKIFHFEDFGAKGTGDIDETAAWESALAAIRNENGAPCILTIPEGKFLFERAKTKESFANIEGNRLSNLIIKGAGPDKTIFISGTHDLSQLKFINCTNISIQDLTLTTKEVPFCQGKITAIDYKSCVITIKHEPRTITPDNKWLQENKIFQSCTCYDDEGNLVRTQFFTYDHGKVENLGDGMYTVELDPRYADSVKNLRIGMNITIPNRIYPAGGFSFNEGNAFCNAERIHVRSSYAAAFGGFNYTSFKDCKLLCREPGLYLASNADAWIGIGSTYISDFYAENPGDDCYNAYTPTYYVDFIHGKIGAPGKFHGRAQANTMRLFMSILTGQVLSMNMLTEVPIPWKAVFADEFVNEIRSHETQKSNHRHLLGGERGLIAYDTTPDLTSDPYAFGIGNVLRNSTYRNSRAGINVQAPCTLVENNSFTNICHGPSIRIGALLLEGTPPFHVTIRNNTSKNSWTGILTQRFIANGKSALCAPIHGLRIENNRIEDAALGLWFQNVSDGELENNQFYGKSYVNPFGEKTNSFIFSMCDGITLSNTTLNDEPLKEEQLEKKNCKDIELR